MPLFRRRRSAASESAAGIDAFWAHWPELRGALAESVDAGSALPEEAAERLTGLVRRIHPALAWEVSSAPPAGGNPLEDLQSSLDADPGELMARLAELDDPAALLGGDGPSYALTLRSGPDDEARIAAERWSRAAPGEPGWTFRPSLPADHEALSRPLDWNGHELDLSHTSVELRADPRRGTLTAGVYHPDFMFLPEEDQAGVAEHVVMLALGEDDYVRAIGAVRALVEKPLDPLPPTSIPSVARQLGHGSGGALVSAEARHPVLGPLEVLLRHPVQRRDFPVFTLLLQVVLPYREADAEKQPSGASAAALEAMDSRLEEVLGADGALFLQQTGGGRREMLFYLDPESQVLPSVEEAVASWSEGRPGMKTQLDPDWSVFNRITGKFRGLS
ncbi:DUF695 domain-containing protein [Nocardiopsis potens]|uniref:DUF695 domain-containing protein n=1 Tax=Nocardiopsis potens TaxID=1246458 RepID=UPI00034D06C6|nr:DUF695 domain-containing protein [Nocardiopsis potens]